MSYTVRVPASGHSFTVNDGETVLEAALREGVGLPYGCRNGTCGKCAGDLLAGEVDYQNDLRAAALAESKTGKALFCQASPKTDLEIAVREITQTSEIEVKIMPCRVEEMTLLTHDVMQLKLRLPENERLQFFAGQYIEFILKDGKRRAFSIANAPHNDGFLELQIRHVPDGHFGDFLFNEMKEKTLLRMEGPHGSYYLREDSDRPIIMVGGGTGYAPLKGMLEHAFHVGVKKPLHLYCGVRALRDLYMHEQAGNWQKRHNNLTYTPVLSDPASEDNWQGAVGFVHEKVVADHPDLSNYDVYMSGPPPMIKAGMDLFYEHGLPETQIYSDSFEYSDDALKAMGIVKPQP